jgi:DHA1 family tetracycline resistance protein-like MFS transporter
MQKDLRQVLTDELGAGNMSVAQAFVSDHTSLSDRAKGFGLIGAAFGVGMMIGPAIGGLLSSSSIHAPLWAAASLSALSLILTFVLLPREVMHDGVREQSESFPFRPIWTTFRAPMTSRIAWLMTVFYFALSTYMPGQALFLAGRSTGGAIHSTLRTSDWYSRISRLSTFLIKCF